MRLNFQFSAIKYLLLHLTFSVFDILWLLLFREFSAVKGFEKSPRAFIMRVSDEEMEDKEFDSDGEEILGQPLASGRRFAYIRF